jgi:hypothetical protein
MPEPEARSHFLARTADLWLTIALGGVAVYLLSAAFTPIRFDRERIEVTVEPEAVRVTALYHYINTSILPIPLTLASPFPIDADHPEPTDVTLAESTADGTPLAELIPRWRNTDAIVQLFFWPGEAKWVRLDYVQPTRVPNGRYILVTTQAWGRPMDHADYFLHLPAPLTLAASSYPLQPGPATPREMTYTFSRQDFYPDQDWTFAWTSPISGGTSQ